VLQFVTPSDIVDFMRPIARQQDIKREHFWVILCDKHNRPQEVHKVSSGAYDHVTASAMDILHHAVGCEDCGKEQAQRIVLVHNHTNGDPTPSDEDIKMTAEVSMVAQRYGIDVIDSIILGDEDQSQWSSFAMRELLPDKGNWTVVDVIPVEVNGIPQGMTPEEVEHITQSRIQRAINLKAAGIEWNPNDDIVDEDGGHHKCPFGISIPWPPKVDNS
jgi:DNA repair protein RadC